MTTRADAVIEAAKELLLDHAACFDGDERRYCSAWEDLNNAVAALAAESPVDTVSHWAPGPINPGGSAAITTQFPITSDEADRGGHTHKLVLHIDEWSDADIDKLADRILRRIAKSIKEESQ
jgi:hypothetical protein